MATRTGFLLLAIDPDRELLVGTAVLAPEDWRPKQQVLPEDFKIIDQEGFALATMNFLIQETGPESCVLSTETRVYATDPASLRKFARYWRMIYPGSAVIRRMWLRAIRANGDLDTYWNWHLQQEHQRNHLSRYQDNLELAA